MTMTTRGDIPELLWPGVDEVLLTHNERYKNEYLMIYGKARPSVKAEEKCVEMRGLGPAKRKAEGRQSAEDSIRQRYVYVFNNKTFSLRFPITYEARSDDLYLSQFAQGTESLLTSYEQNMEQMGMVPFNNGFTSALADGVPLCDASHPYDGGVFSNRVGGNIGVDLSETAIEQAIILASRLVDQAGLKIKGTIDKIVLSPEKFFSGYRITKSEHRSGTANNDINVLDRLSNTLLPGGIIQNHFLTNTSDVFFLTNFERGRRFYEREKPKISSWTDDNTKTMYTDIIGRYSFGTFTPLGVIGMKGL